MNTCKICGQSKSTFTLKIEEEANECGYYDANICSSCWDTISEIASRRYEKRITALEVALAGLLGNIDNKIKNIAIQTTLMMR